MLLAAGAWGLGRVGLGMLRVDAAVPKTGIFLMGCVLDVGWLKSTSDHNKC
jgi:hypothetical protein